MDDIQMTSRRREVRLMRRTLFPRLDLPIYRRSAFAKRMHRARAVYPVHQIRRHIAIMQFYEDPVPERPARTVRKFARPSTRLFVHFANASSAANRFAAGAYDSSRGDTRRRAAYSSSRQDERRRKILLLDSRVMHKCIDRALAFPLGSLSSLLGG